MIVNILKFLGSLVPVLNLWIQKLNIAEKVKAIQEAASEIPSLVEETKKLTAELKEALKDKKVSAQEALGLVDNIEAVIKETYEVLDPLKALKK